MGYKQLVLKEIYYYGVVAQLGERLNGIQEVRGSIPLSSTNKENGFYARFFIGKNKDRKRTPKKGV